MDDNLRRAATADECRLLELIHEVYTQLGVWPIWQHVEGEMLQRFDMDARPVLEGLPRISVHGGYGWTVVESNNVTWPNPGDKVGLSICGLSRIPNGQTAAKDFVRVVSYLGHRRRTVVTDPVTVQDVVVTREEIHRDMRDRTKGDRDWWSAPENELDRHARFIDKEPPTWNCQVQWPATGGFEITVSPLMSRYFDVS